MLCPTAESSVLNSSSLGFVLVLAYTGLVVVGTVLAGWGVSGVSKYGALGVCRSIVQVIAYEVSIGLSLLPVLYCACGGC